jgi:hypothetical protein
MLDHKLFPYNLYLPSPIKSAPYNLGLEAMLLLWIRRTEYTPESGRTPPGLAELIHGGSICVTPLSSNLLSSIGASPYLY